MKAEKAIRMESVSYIMRNKFLQVLAVVPANFSQLNGDQDINDLLRK